METQYRFSTSTKSLHIINRKCLEYNYAKRIQEISSLYQLPKFDCLRLFQNNTAYLEEAILRRNNITSDISDDYYLNVTTDCHDFQLSRGYIMSSLTQEEEEFPIAYTIMAYKDSEMVERLLRAIYRPQNYYCIHVDLKSSESFYSAISAISQCFPNVFLASKRIEVIWGLFSVLEPELICMKELSRYKKWKYFINLTGQMFPLKTNYQIVKILKAFRGANSINGTIKYAYPTRWKGKTPPRGIRLLKGSVHIAANRDFVNYVLHNETAKEFLEWNKDTFVPDETFFSSLNYNPQLGIKGTYKGDPDDVHEYVARYTIWGSTFKLCAGKFVRGVCILSSGDLPRLGQAKELFANKFYLHEDRLAIGCLEEKIFNDTRDVYMGVKVVNTSFYERLNFVQDQVE
ncbi:beta-1,3-galactosyl-O-glycosyl-glycoprotein beta-1,6-N-acetylglucosaminyltransferase-like [Physella acuta]|uniref:beta-1,3-galactosyl-O-glycosyl-glycoprotein beta-1,6-N-acetylglucosaminyltransferase-like n=1 Tax=Physella acuta TaxID=109671 RepID=UPI0027DBAB7F|nr:beta-1,3-galactosyl-O-glycosyl-glycoprotein beta-1,6-N-acetylglucosaminyltransferase-like [Physella acuta]